MKTAAFFVQRSNRRVTRKFSTNPSPQAILLLGQPLPRNRRAGDRQTAVERRPSHPRLSCVVKVVESGWLMKRRLVY